MYEGAMTVIQIHKDRIEDVPVLHVVKDQYFKEKVPLVLFIHGFESAKEHNLHYAYLLAEKGFRVVLPEIMYHGEREVDIPKIEVMYKFWDIILHTIHEIEVIKDHYVLNGLCDQERIGLVGTSMGGIITCGALTQYEWIKTAIILMGSPNYEEFAKEQIHQLRKNGVNIPLTNNQLEDQFLKLREYDLSKKPNMLKQRPIFLWHGVKDNMVPYQPTYDFYKKIKSNQYQNHPKRLSFLTDQEAGHKVSRKGLLKSVEWFEKWL
jgi:uncharacterized protein